MKPGAGKRKGSGFEREVCKKLSLWITNGKRTDCLWRSAMSGGRATVQGRKGVDIRQAGDICSVSPEGHRLTDYFYMETKFHRVLQIDRFIILGTGKLAKFWQETIKQARKYERQPMLIAKQNGLPVLLIMQVAAGVQCITMMPRRGNLYLFDNLLRSSPKVFLGLNGHGRGVR